MPEDSPILTNAEIADRLSTLAQLLSIQKANPYKIRAYRRAADTVRSLGESIDELVRSGADLTIYSGIGDAIHAALREIVLTGTLTSLEKLRSNASPELLSISAYPRLDPKRVLRIFKKLKISSTEALQQALESGEIEQIFGLRMAQHVRQGLVQPSAIILYHAHRLVPSIETYLLKHAGAARVQVVGDYRRRVEVIEELWFVVETNDFPGLVTHMQRYGGRTPLIESTTDYALFALAAGPLLKIHLANADDWGLALIRHTGSKAHLKKLVAVTGNLTSLEADTSFATEHSLYESFGMAFIEPELREGRNEVRQARRDILPILVTQADILGDLHTHTEASDGSNSIEQMAAAARNAGYAYIGISDHSQSLKIAGGVSEEDLWTQVRRIDRLNEQLQGIRVLKSAEVDILADGKLDYSDELLRELDYTVCSIHSRFAFGKEKQTERIIRAMDNRFFTILGHATGRLLLKRPGYEIDMERVAAHAKQNGCFFEINSSPDRLDLSAENARLAAQLGIMIAISTDAHSIHEFGTIRYGIEQARRAGLEKSSILNCQSLESLTRLFKR
ncbi:MAG TPA: PHP domain-containing protein [Acidobacteriaceae bacterium]|jgi:DNA polymerase (family 10)